MLWSLLSPACLAVAVSFLGAAQAQAPFYKIGTSDEIRESARTLAYDMMLFYSGNQSGQIPGILPGPPPDGNYYWWEGGAMMGTYIDYWKLTGDSTYNSVIMEGMLHQVGDHQDYQPRNHTLSLGNDDQGFWGMSALLAAENKFPNPPADKPQWLALAQAVWNTQADPSRYDGTCGGGLRWQIPPTNPGYTYKNTISNGIFFNMGARLARYTNDDKYAKRAEEAWDWLWSVNYVDHETWDVYDGGHVDDDCKDITKSTFSYNAAVLTQGAAYMYNYTNAGEKWKNVLDSLLARTLQQFFPDNVAYEVPCEGDGKDGTCTPDMLSFKGYVHRWLSVVTQVAPYTAGTILPVLRNSTEAAIKQCTGPKFGRQCGFYWRSGVFVDPGVDKTTGAGEAMNVLAAVSSLLITEAEPPVTNTTGGISPGNPNAGGNTYNGEVEYKPITMADKVGAGIITFLMLSACAGMSVWMSAFD